MNQILEYADTEEQRDDGFDSTPAGADEAVSDFFAGLTGIGGPNGAVVGWCQITPSLAHSLLALRNKDNVRPRSDLVARRYAADMKEGKWTQCYDPIVFDALECLQNGQHRLRAVMASGCPQIFAVVVGAGAKDKEGMDRGRVRNIATTHGVPFKHSAALSTYLLLRDGTAPDRAKIANIYAAHRGVIVGVHRTLLKGGTTQCVSWIQAAWLFAAIHAKETDRPRVWRAMGEFAESRTNSVTVSAMIREAQKFRLSRRGSFYDKADEAVCLIAGIVAYIKSEDRKNLRFNLAPLKWLSPSARYRPQAGKAVE